MKYNFADTPARCITPLCTLISLRRAPTEKTERIRAHTAQLYIPAIICWPLRRVTLGVMRVHPRALTKNENTERELMDTLPTDKHVAIYNIMHSCKQTPSSPILIKRKKK